MRILYRRLLFLFALTATGPAMAAGHQCQAPGSGQPLELSGCRAGDNLVLHGLNFDSGTAELQSSSLKLLQQLGRELLDNPGIRVSINGHTDNIGVAQYNLELSRKRAEAVRQYLVNMGVGATRLQADGFGSTDPLASNSSADGRARNRRVELVLQGSGQPPVRAAAPPPPPKTIYMTTFSAQPASLTVPVGTTVTWKNYDEITHSVVLPDASSERLWAAGWNGQTFSKTFTQAGEYPFQCGVHNDVHGKIVVTAAGQPSTDSAKPGYPGHTLANMPSQASSAPAPAMHHARAAPAPAAETPPAASGNQVVIQNHAFAPAQIKVPVGGRVSWSNQDGSGHIVKFSDLSSERMSRGDSFSRSFDAPGEYEYSCGIHGYMKGTVLVGS